VNKADVVLPTTTFAEADGVFVNTEGRVQKSERIIEPLDNAKPDWWIYSQLAKRMGSNSFGYQESKDIWKEIQKNNSGFAKIAPSKLRSQKEAFIHEPAKRKAKLVAMTSKAWVENDRKKYPMLMTFDCNLDQYKSLVLSEENTNFRVFRDSRWIMINHEDAAQLNLNDGDRVEIEFPASKIQAIARISNRVVRGQAVAAFAHTVLGVNPIPNSLPVKIKRGK
jgi:formate dehydrogenase major subunit